MQHLAMVSPIGLPEINKNRMPWSPAPILIQKMEFQHGRKPVIRIVPAVSFSKFYIFFLLFFITLLSSRLFLSTNIHSKLSLGFSFRISSQSFGMVIVHCPFGVLWIFLFDIIWIIIWKILKDFYYQNNVVFLKCTFLWKW